MPLYQVLIYAIIQGITEFIPVSSSAHLAILPQLMHWEDPGLAFDIALHVGTLLAVVAYFFKDWVQIIGQGFGLTIGTDEELKRNKILLWLIIVGTVPIGIAGKLLNERAENEWRTLPIMGTMLVVVGLVMWLAERMGEQKRDLTGIVWMDAIIIGLLQALAIVPGTSRSGITITAGLFRGLKREAAARFSFLLLTPAVAGAAVLALLKLKKAGGIPPDMKMPFVVGILVSGIVGALVIGLFMKYLRGRSLYPFIYYRIVFGIIVIALALFR